MNTPDSVLFVGDVHLNPRSPRRAEEFVSYCRVHASGMRALYVLGDLFDHWVTPRQEESPFYARVLDGLREVAATGTRVLFQSGNRDFLLTGGPLARRGIEELADWHSVRIGDDAVLVTHGDLLCTRDRPYQRMRSVLRMPMTRVVSGMLSLERANRLGERFRGVSTEAVALKAPGIAELAPETIHARFRSGHHDVLICGHVHRPRFERWHVAGRRRLVAVIPDWSTGPGALLAVGGEWFLTGPRANGREMLRAPW